MMMGKALKRKQWMLTWHSEGVLSRGLGPYYRWDSFRYLNMAILIVHLAECRKSHRVGE